MLVLNVTYKCAHGKRAEYREAIRAEGIDAASRKEDGNFKYDFYLSTEDPDDLLLIEFWRDEAALEAHRHQPHYLKMGGIKEGRVLGTEIKKYFTDEEK